MSDEPVYCTWCGQEWGFGCDENCATHDPKMTEPESFSGPFCHLCGVEGDHAEECRS